VRGAVPGPPQGILAHGGASERHICYAGGGPDHSRTLHPTAASARLIEAEIVIGCGCRDLSRIEMV
jgi:hypothetical protein